MTTLRTEDPFLIAKLSHRVKKWLSSLSLSQGFFSQRGKYHKTERKFVPPSSPPFTCRHCIRKGRKKVLRKKKDNSGNLRSVSVVRKGAKCKRKIAPFPSAVIIGNLELLLPTRPISHQPTFLCQQRAAAAAAATPFPAFLHFCRKTSPLTEVITKGFLLLQSPETP